MLNYPNSTNLLLFHAHFLLKSQVPLNKIIQQSIQIKIIKLYLNYINLLDNYMYSIVPQNVCVRAPSCICSLHKPKSVNLICPSASNRIFSGFKSLKQFIIRIISRLLADKTFNINYIAALNYILTLNECKEILSEKKYKKRYLYIIPCK